MHHDKEVLARRTTGPAARDLFIIGIFLFIDDEGNHITMELA